MIYLNEVKIFVYVVEAGSFVGAGKKLGMPSTTVSRKVQQLEEALGVRLLNRSTRKLSMTSAGEAYYQQCHTFLHAMDKAHQSLQQSQNEPQGLVRLAAPYDFSAYFLQPIINEFLAQYPKVTVDLMVNDNIVDMIDNSVDVAFRSGHLQGLTLVARKIMTKRIVYCASQAYIQQFGEPETPEDLSKHNCILWRQSEGQQYWAFSHGEDVVDHPVAGRFATDNTHLHINAALTGVGIARLPEGLAAPYFASGNLQQVLAGHTFEAGNMYIVYQSHHLLPSAARHFIDFAVEKLIE
ncbi:LysR family transcriptional regulator [Photobacterium sanctipauli]|nr:LysR family transcriptional regulator [Photobacterium sanctipauli]